MIVPMKRLTLIGLKEDESALLQALQAIKAVQILPPEEGRESERVAQLESRVQRLNSAQLALRPFAPKQGLGPKPQATAQELADGLEDSLRLCDQVEELERAVSASQAEADKRRSLMAQLQPWEGLSCPGGGYPSPGGGPVYHRVYAKRADPSPRGCRGCGGGLRRREGSRRADRLPGRGLCPGEQPC